ncbi:hypothetical protein SPBR_08344 [Sporothrix brasiliensis 5110]|uniref:Ig-like domain-containing protein n=1 Tax=Sporothrix brasiliensis 5110 TaxID=1398154 RepID=A0A0C2IHN7_9PEZI|nr:uncharacterized protein SPBR_08344 [Sporothrix brasiliensis 5110]KIH86520.1 hypothetical protein SPBR_08344 [Sporothrix brasiliensis 5110]
MLSLSVLLLASPTAVLLVSAQVSPPQSPIIPGCTTSSFSIPSWYVQNLTVSQTAGTAFHVVNRATNRTAAVTCPAGGAAHPDGWTPCRVASLSPLFLDLGSVVQASANSTTVRVGLNETWTCSDRNASQPLTFSAEGTASAKLSCGGKNATGCTAVDDAVLVRGSLHKPVEVTPAYSKGPPGHAKPGCAANSKTPRWTLSDVSYVDRTGDGVTSMARKDFIAQLVNAATGYESGCSAYYGVGGGPPGLGGGPPTPGTLPNNTSPTALHVGCTGVEFSSSGIGQYRPQTDASFDPATSTFTVNQTWFCDDGDAARPVQITAVGSSTLSLRCVTKTLPGSSSTDGGNGTVQTSKQCVPAASKGNGTTSGITVTGHVTSTVALPAYSIEEPQPVPDGCTVSSLLNPVWIYSAFGYSQKNGSAGVTGISFNLILQTSNPGFQFPISISQGPKWSGNTTLPLPVGNATTTTTESWYDCIIGNGGDDSPTLWPHDCRFQYVPSTKQLSLVADWYCSDLDRQHPVAFSGRSTTVVSKKVNCGPTTVNGVVNKEGLQTCVAVDTSDSWTAPITDVTWKSA